MALTHTQVEQIFNSSFSGSHNVRLLGGFEEPEYIPPNFAPSRIEPSEIKSIAQVCYKLDYVQSALHEAAHWCVAGAKRRELLDYGYWYAPDGRDANQQKAFFLVESRSQSLEWLFSSAAGVPFQPSVDNLNLQGGVAEPLPIYFVEQMKNFAIEYLSNNSLVRSNQFISALRNSSGELLISASEIIETEF